MSTATRSTPEKVSARAGLEKERLQRKGQEVSTRLTPIKLYLLSYNLLTLVSWSYLLYLTISVFISPTATPSKQPSTILQFLSASSSRSILANLPKPISNYVTKLSGAYHYHNLGWWTKIIQTTAVLEIIHGVLGWTRTSVGTTIAQVASRLWTVWAVVEPCPETHSNPLFATMLLAWSITEVIRSSFYVFSILNINVPLINYLRYNLFLILYPLGASSEAFLSLSALPQLSTLPLIPKSWSPGIWILSYLPSSWARLAMRSSFGRALIWKAAQAGLAGKKNQARKAFGLGVKGWGVMEVAKLGLFVVWWPALYVLYTHMLKQRRKYFSKGVAVGRKTQ